MCEGVFSFKRSTAVSSQRSGQQALLSIDTNAAMPLRSDTGTIIAPGRCQGLMDGPGDDVGKHRARICHVEAAKDLELYTADGFIGATIINGVSETGRFFSGSFYDLDATAEFAFDKHLIGRVAESGTPLLNGFATLSSTSHPGGALYTVLDLDSEVVVGGTVFATVEDTGPRFFAAKLDADLEQVKWSSVYSSTGESGDGFVDEGEAHFARTTPDGELMLWGSDNSPGTIAHVVKASMADGASACSSAPHAVEASPLAVSLFASYAVQEASGLLFDPQSATLAADPLEPLYQPEIETLCPAGE
jgi:hypothetical protein